MNVAIRVKYSPNQRAKLILLISQFSQTKDEKILTTSRTNPLGVGK